MVWDQHTCQKWHQHRQFRQQNIWLWHQNNLNAPTLCTHLMHWSCVSLKMEQFCSICLVLQSNHTAVSPNLATLQKADVILGNSLQLSQYIVSGGRFIVVKNFYLCKKNFSPGKFVNCFRNSNDTWETRPFGEGLLTDWIFLVNAVGDIFPPYNLFTRIRRRPFCESVMCAVGAAIFDTKNHLQSLQDFISKSVY